MVSSTQQLPSDIAREALRRLAQRRIAPTPDNYAQVYCEISGRDDQSSIMALRLLEGLAADLGKREGALQPGARALALALAERHWEDARKELDELCELATRGPDWGSLLRSLFKQLETRHAAYTDARKREMLDHVLTAFGGDGMKLHARLSGVVKAWSESAPAQRVELTLVSPAKSATEKSAPQPVETPAALERSGETQPLAQSQSQPVSLQTSRELLRKVLWLVADTIERGVVERLTHSPKLAEEARAIIQAAQWASTAAEVDRLGEQLKHFWLKFELSGEGPDRVIDGLGALLRLVVENVGELVADERWVSAQIDQMREVLDGPIDVRSLREAERSFRRVLYRQAAAKFSLDEAKNALKSVLTTFIDRIGTMAADTGSYQERMARYAEELAQTDDIHRISDIVQQLTQDTRSMHTDMQRNYDELESARRHAAVHEEKIRVLEQELESISQQVREDGLTRALNRRGLTEAFVVEAVRSDRDASPLCLAILDVDDFKVLNDRYGHATGDEALVHLSNVIRRTLRPTDIVARYGGEEFVILLPATSIGEAAEIMRRTQRELTRHFFLHDNERLLITFSAGVAQRRGGEEQHALIDRADAALYLAKKRGKNQVAQAEV
ncbi:MAG TPA: GGDEF domain-containing protein [Burkholderiales bacterium]|nr:GGDEF domain-containing protein [Burkholderiales bacterium]